MQRIPTIYVRDLGTRLVTREVLPVCEWVFRGEGIAYRKWNGLACLVKGGTLFKRFDAKKGRNVPPGAIPAEPPDPKAPYWPMWVPIGLGKEDKWYRLAFYSRLKWPDGTYELIGPKVNGNPDRVKMETLMSHTATEIVNVPLDFDMMKRFFEPRPFEGVVWHHPDGRMAKIKTKDFWGEEEPWPRP